MAAKTPTAPPPGPLSPWLYQIGAPIFALAATGATLMLVLEQVVGMPLPGCTGGADSPCARASASVWGKVPGLGWPVSFLGFAYFASVLAALLYLRGGTNALMQNVLRAGGAISLLYLLVIVFGGYSCQYCIAAHVANLALWGLTEATRRTVPRTMRSPLIPLSATFALATVAVGMAEYSKRQELGRAGDVAMQDSVKQIIDAGTNTAPVATQPTPTRPASAPPAATQAAPTPPTATQAAPATLPVVTQKPAEPAFTGRYRLGPEKAAIRVVIFSDYQCEDCRRIESEIEPLLQQHPQMSFSAKHFPFSTDCNPYAGRNLHGDACWAARAAEAAGLLGGNEAFWKMHDWLFERKGTFSRDEIMSAASGMGLDPAEFDRTMQGPETLARVKADIEEGYSLGLFMTPMIFINGVELKGWRETWIRDRKPTLPPRIAQVAAANLPPAGPEADRPPRAADSMVIEWRERAPISLPPAQKAFTRGPQNAKVRVVLFGDYLEPGTAKADAAMRQLQAARPDMTYTYRYFPFNQSCNPHVTSTKFAAACSAAKAAAAAGELGGPAGFWGMHEWLMANQGKITDASILSAAATLGFEAAAFQEKMNSPEVAALLRADVDAAKSAGLTAIPWIFVNEKLIPRWQQAGTAVLEKVVAEAGGG